MNSLRLVPETSLLIISGLVEPALARDFQAEWIDQLNEEQQEKHQHVRKGFFDADYGIQGVLSRPELPATHRILDILKLVSMDDTAIGMNYQSPHGAQNFHQDNPTVDGQVYVVHGADGGVFDYAPTAQTREEAEESFLSIEVNAGDLLLQTSQQLIHRGRNASDSPRVTAGIARIASDRFSNYSWV